MTNRASTSLSNTCPSCDQVVDVSACAPFSEMSCPRCGETMWVRQLFRHYEIRAEIGRGGMSRVFRAYDPTLDRHVALKILLEQFNRDDERVQQFEKEAQITASFAHPHVVRVYAVERELKDLVIVMELVENGSLEEHVTQHGKIPEKQALTWILDTAQGLQAAFQNGLIHRDVKPGNILLDHDRSAKLVDFGLALMFQSEKDDSEDIWATPYYVAPEKLLGQGEDHRSDIYSLGATLFHLLAGKPSFNVVSGSYEELRKAKLKPVSTKALATAHVSPAVCRLVERMMAPKPQDRPESYETLIRLMEHVLPSKRSPTGFPGKVSASPNLGSAGQRFLARQRVRRGAEKRRRMAVGIFLTISLAAILIATWKKRQDELAGNHPNTSLASEAAEGQATSPGNDVPPPGLSAAYAQGRSRLEEGQAEEALEAFSQALNDHGLHPQHQHWTRFHLGLSQLLLQKERASRQTFGTLFRETDGAAEAASAFLHQASFHLQQDQSVPIDSTPSSARQPDEAVALLAYGLKNWERKAFPEAKAHLSLYAEQVLTKDAFWAGDYRRLVNDHLTDLQWLSQSPDVDQLRTPSELNDAQHKLRQHIKEAKTSMARSVAEELLLDVTRQLEHDDSQTPRPQDTDAPSPDLALALNEAESKVWHEGASSRANLLKTFDFKKGLADLQAQTETFNSPAGRWFIGDQCYAWSMAANFIDNLMPALVGKQGPIVRLSDRQTMEGEIVDANPEALSIKSASGTVSISLAQIAPTSLVRLALEVIEETRDSNLYYRRQEELVFFAFLLGLDAVLEQQATLLRRENRPFRQRWDRLQTFKASLSQPSTKPAQHG